MRSKRCFRLFVLPRIPPTVAPFMSLLRRIQPAARVFFLAAARQKVCRPCTEGSATFWVVLCLFSPLFRPKRNVGRGRIPSDFVDAALFAAQGVSCLRP